MNIDKDIGENPTPQQVKDYYDLHTGEGAANFSDEDAGITVQLWHSLAQALEENERLKEGIDKVVAGIRMNREDRYILIMMDELDALRESE